MKLMDSGRLLVMKIWEMAKECEPFTHRKTQHQNQHYGSSTRSTTTHRSARRNENSSAGSASAESRQRAAARTPRIQSR